MSQQLSVFVRVELYFNNRVILFIVLRLYRHFYVLVFDVLHVHFSFIDVLVVFVKTIENITGLPFKNVICLVVECVNLLLSFF